jgi:uncharacterized membrane protein YeaQ/YmgE (transglycosylase-associated protein family)
MDVLDCLALLFVAGICGAAGQAIGGYSFGGFLVAVALGFIGALIGMWLARSLALPEMFPVYLGTTRFPTGWALVGSTIFVGFIGMFSRRRF